jgi:hypothetical protein
MSYLKLGLAVLTAAFVISFIASVGVGEPYRVVNILHSNPSSYTEYVLHAFVWLFLPPLLGLLLLLGSFKWDRKLSTEVPKWPLGVFGCLFLFNAVLVMNFSWNTYVDALRSANLHNVIGIDNLLLSIYATAFAAGVLWLISSVTVFFLLVKYKLHDIRPTAQIQTSNQQTNS